MKEAELKAKELVEKFEVYAERFIDDKKNYPLKMYSALELRENAKQCAIIAVDEIIRDYERIHSGRAAVTLVCINKVEFWDAVKEEINKI